MKKCVICGKELKPDVWHIQHQATCGGQCNILRQRRLKQERLAERRPKILHCEMCDKEFSANKHSWHKAKWCLNCRKIAHREQCRKYHQLHPQTSRQRRKNKWYGNWLKALERDKDICQICGKKGVLVHHIDGSGERKNPNHSLENLQVLCFSCHKKLHEPTFKISIAEKKIYLSGLLFQVYSDYQVIIEK